MRWSDVPFSPSSRILRQFASLWLVVFSAIAFWQGWKHGRTELAIAIGVAAVVVGVAGLIRPASVRPIFVGWVVLAFPIGWIVSNLLMALVYFGMFVPLGFLLRLTGRDPLRLAFKPVAASYWRVRPPAPRASRYFRQY